MRKTFLFTLVCLMVATLATPAFAASSHSLDLTLDLTAQAARVHNGFGAALTPATTDSPQLVVRSFLEPRHATRTFDTLKLTREFTAPNTPGITHLRMQQEIDGLAVYGTYVRAAVNEYGELVWLAENLVTPPSNGLVAAKIGAERALATALRELHPGLGDFTRVDLDGNTTTFGGDPAFFRAPQVTRVALPMQDGSLQVGFLVETWTDEDNLLHHTLVSGTGQIVGIELRTNTDSYNIFPDHPGNSSQTIVAGPGTGNAESPIGWLDSGDHSSIEITGNNTRTYLDTSASNTPDATRPDGTAGDVISDGNFVAVADLNAEPEDGVNPDAAVQNLFYYCNEIHDKLYAHGFVESTGNFQQDNFGNGGAGGDPVLCEAQDGSGTNNANFSTPSDGSSGRMQMFVWTQTSPKRDGDLDSDIIWHEYGHGLTWRMIGSMSGPMSGAIGEGNSDVLSLLANGNDVVGEYSFNDPLGIRSESYTDYSRTYGDFDGGSVHFDGEIYAAIHWDLMGRYAAGGFTVDDHWSDMVGGMNFTPSGPAFEDMRDGMLAQAPSTRDCLIWESFAKFGVGVNASGSVSGGGPFGGGNVNITEDFSVPAECTSCTVTENPETSCSDGVDNDCDGAIDSNDTDCGSTCTVTEDPEVTCDDGVDNDCDGLIDADDSDCDTGSCTLGQKGDACSSDSDCCSNKCRGPSGRMTCK